MENITPMPDTTSHFMLGLVVFWILVSIYLLFIQKRIGLIEREIGKSSN